MALTWSIEKVADWETLADDEWERLVTEALVFASMAVGIGRITKDNAADFYARLRMVELVEGSYLRREGERYLITVADVRRRVGMTTNVSTATSNDIWARGWVKGVITDLQRAVTPVGEKS